jgi:hypothetical protein
VQTNDSRCLNSMVSWLNLHLDSEDSIFKWTQENHSYIYTKELIEAPKLNSGCKLGLQATDSWSSEAFLFWLAYSLKQWLLFWLAYSLKQWLDLKWSTTQWLFDQELKRQPTQSATSHEEWIEKWDTHDLLKNFNLEKVEFKTRRPQIKLWSMLWNNKAKCKPYLPSDHLFTTWAALHWSWGWIVSPNVVYLCYSWIVDIIHKPKAWLVGQSGKRMLALEFHRFLDELLVTAQIAACMFLDKFVGSYEWLIFNSSLQAQWFLSLSLSVFFSEVEFLLCYVSFDRVLSTAPICALLHAAEEERCANRTLAEAFFGLWIMSTI